MQEQSDSLESSNTDEFESSDPTPLPDQYK